MLSPELAHVLDKVKSADSSEFWSFGSKVKTYRTRAKLTQDKLAYILGPEKDASFLHRIEKNANYRTDIVNVLNICLALRLNEDEAANLLECGGYGIPDSYLKIAFWQLIPVYRGRNYPQNEEKLSSFLDDAKSILSEAYSLDLQWL